jgi:Domain of unknown function (DUF5615)
MNFVADESCAGPVVRALREAGHDVIAIAEVANGATDEEVLNRALDEKRCSLQRIGISAGWCTHTVGPQRASFLCGFTVVHVMPNRLRSSAQWPNWARDYRMR